MTLRKEGSIMKNIFQKTAAILSIASLAIGFNFVSAQGFSPRQSPPETQSVPGNMLLALSVEFPTGLQVSYTNANYDNATTYDGYFDNRKCYSYNSTNEFFSPESGRTATGACPNTAHWSGNLLNWLTMSNLDQFRSVMTGGTRDNFSSKNATHPGDNTDRTILIRSLSDRNSYNPIKNLSNTWVGLPNTLGGAATDTVRSGGFGSKFFISDSNNFTDLNASRQRETCADTVARGLAGMGRCYNIRVEVCKVVPSVTVLGVTTAGVGREDNCKGPYGSGINTYYKPEGLVQEYSSSIRFGAMGYLNQTGQDRSGGVLRARMKSVGATLIGEGNAANSNKEWGTDGILNANPDPVDATASGVAQSGLINYINLFGYAAGYKGNDPVSELYYAAQLYLRNQSFPASYTDDLTAARLDGFPVISNFTDPIIRSCQKNFILGLGDIFTHCDGNLPGSPNTGGGTCPGVIPTDPNGLNVGTLWDSVTAMHGSTTWVGGSTGGRPYMAGLAWWGNVNDVRPDLSGKQSISTYWVDVLENNNGGTGIAAQSQFWLAAKYGGFRQELVTNNGTNPNTTVGSWDRDGNGIPDTLFAGNSPSVLKQSLRAAFQDIASRAEDSSASSAAVTSNRQTSNSQIIYAGYNPKNWTGGVRSCSPTQTAVQCDASPIWEASRWFDTTYTVGATPKLNSSNRKIFTSNLDAGTFTKMPFLWANLNVSQKAILDAPNADNRGSDRVSYLRGDTTLDGTVFRRRGSALMGDIVNSNITYLSGSGPLYRTSNFPNHDTYWTGNKARPPVVYVGANDGMLHAIDALTGKELWAYIPSSVFTKLPNLTNTTFVHQYLVDGTAMTADTETGDVDTPWRTILVGGLGAGGRGYYALDISRQMTHSTTGKNFSNMTEAELSAIPMWEFTDATDADLGYSFNEPPVDPITGSFLQLRKVASSTVSTGEWRVILGNGYGSPSNKATLFMLNTETGAISSKITATTGGGVNGLSTPTPVDTNGDGIVDVIYAGDLLGKLHKFQFSKLAVNGIDYIQAASGDVDGVWRYIGVLYSADGPITTAPSVTKSKLGVGWQVQFGAGKLVEDSDFTNTDSRSFYSVVDNNTSSSLIVASTELATITITTTTTNGVSYRNWTAPNLSGKKGWQMTFSGGERIISNPTIPPDTGVVLFGTAKPSGDLCEPGSSGFLMAVNLANGATGDILIDGLVVGGYGVTASGVLKVSNTYSNSQNKQTIVCNQADCQKSTPPTIKSNSAPKARYSWRQLLSR